MKRSLECDDDSTFIADLTTKEPRVGVHPSFTTVEVFNSFITAFPDFDFQCFSASMVPYLIGRLNQDATLLLFRTYPGECRTALIQHFDAYYYEEDDDQYKSDFLYILSCFQQKKQPDFIARRCEFEVRSIVQALKNVVESPEVSGDLNSVDDLPARRIECVEDLKVDLNEPLHVANLVKDRWADLFLNTEDKFDRFASIAAYFYSYVTNSAQCSNDEITNTLLNVMVNPRPLPLPFRA